MLKRLAEIFVITLALCALSMCAQAAQVLEDGAAGETVMVLTRRLVELGFMAESADEYDERVASAVADFQTANGLARTGVADINTQQMLYASDVVTRAEYMTAFSAKYDGKTLSMGENGDEVSAMQTVLMELGYYDFYVDGKFGEGTRRAVANYQRANGLESTGIADEAMFIRLYEGESISYTDYVYSQCAVKGDSGMNVRAIQKRLIELGYFTGEAAGTYGEITARAVSRFQYDNALDQSGNVDVATYEALFDVNAQPAEDDGSLYPGDNNDDVRAMQDQLADMGFYFHEPTGSYGMCTQTAVMLFRAANGMEISENADREVLEMLYSGSARDVTALSGSIDTVDDEMIVRMCDYALSCAGKNYTDLDEKYQGLGFMRYVFAREGVDIGNADAEVQAIVSAAEMVSYVSRGDIIIMQRSRNGSEVTAFALCVGGGSIAWVNDVTGSVEVVALDTVEYTGVYVWKVGQ